jgi:hypothetical protein
MNDLTARIQQLDSATAERILRVVAQHRVAEGIADRIELDASLVQALSAEADLPVNVPPATSGDVARIALLILAEDPGHRSAIDQMVAKPPLDTTESYDPTAFLAIGTAALVILQMHVKVEKTPGKAWSFKFEKKPLGNSLLRLLIQKIIGFLGCE